MRAYWKIFGIRCYGNHGIKRINHRTRPAQKEMKHQQRYMGAGSADGCIPRMDNPFDTDYNREYVLRKKALHAYELHFLA
ncbi:hypothetical protein LIER_27494 [Lithospermum erythrorhizon]|uniref:Uncharacterized protein n=1 Tax=Lithospermum erythrorhizon TaxID=34254 RepID=A0AAV3RDS7_LITER